MFKLSKNYNAEQLTSGNITFNKNEFISCVETKDIRRLIKKNILVREVKSESKKSESKKSESKKSESKKSESKKSESKKSSKKKGKKWVKFL